MRRIAFTLLATAVLGCSPTGERLVGGEATDWDRWSGRWVVVNYWAEWCGPCREEIPELNRLHHAGGDDGAVVLGVNFDGLRGEALTGVMDRMGIEFPVLEEDPRARWDLPLPNVLPSTLIIDPEGQLREVLVGPQTYESLSRAVALSETL